MSTNISIATIRAQYPTPETANPYGPNRDGDYCVGGALALAFYGLEPDTPRFPEEDAIAEVLQALNPAIADTLALEYADALVDANDAGDFEEAWRVAGKALAYGQEGGPQDANNHH